MIEVGQIVGNYRVTAKLGEGGMGMVFRVEHPVIARRAALKAIHPELLRSPDVIARFVNEAKAIGQIGHEHIVDITDFGRTPAGDFYFIMEYLSGEDLAEAIHRGAPLPPARALAIAAQIADALSASHARGIMHRDLKPENVYLVSRGGARDFVKVLDFGLAKLIARDGAELDETSSSTIMGTPYYMAPEQCEGRRDTDHRADVYALGVMLFEMLTGKLPFGGETSGEILMKHVTTRPPAARALVPHLSEALDGIVQRALAKDPDERFPSMAAFRAALLDPTGAGAAPKTGSRDDLTGRTRAARPMARGELTTGGHRSPGTRTTFREGVGAFASDPDLALVPARSGRAWLTAAVVATVAMALVVGVARGRASEPTTSAAALRTAETIRVTFASDPTGAAVVGADGQLVGATPLSIELAAGNVAVDFVFRKAGFVSKTMSIIPNISSPVFALLQAEPSSDPPVVAASSGGQARARPRHRSRLPSFRLPEPPPDADDVLAPTLR